MVGTPTTLKGPCDPSSVNTFDLFGISLNLGALTPKRAFFFAPAREKGAERCYTKEHEGPRICY